MTGSSVQDTLQEARNALQSKKMAFLVGAGISAGRQSWLPTWRELTEAMLLAISGENWEQEVSIVIPHLDRLLTEVIFQLMIPEIGKKSAFRPLLSTMLSEDYSEIHKFLAYFIIKHNAVVLTTNYDILIETAAKKSLDCRNLQIYAKSEEYNKWDGSSGALMKLHGTVDDLDSTRFAINQVFRGLDKTMEKVIRKVLETRVLFVIGYRGADEFDINPILFNNNQQGCGIKWLVHKDTPEPWIQTYLSSVGGTWLKVDSDTFLGNLYDAVGGSIGQQRDNKLKQRRQPGWWRSELIDWGKELHSNNPGGATFLWARILEYLYFYKASADAYQRARLNLGNDTKAFEARFQQAWMLRQASRSVPEIEQAFQDLQDVSIAIKIQLENRASNIDREKFQYLLGSVMHQIGIALEALERFHEAKMALEDAEYIYRQLQEPWLRLPYTVFQQFMNARQANWAGKNKIDDLAPNGWRRWLSNYLADAAAKYKEEGFAADYATTVHNRAFVHQFLAEELEREGKYDNAELEFQMAWTLYLDAWNYRNRLYDQRYVAQSEVRLAECELSFARRAMQKKDKFIVRFMAQRAFDRTVVVRELYASIPQQEFRVRDIERIEEEATKICGEYGFRPLRSYLR
jgi:hypothetical protein